VDFRPEAAAKQIPLYFAEWFFGSLVLAVLAGAVGMFSTFVIARAMGRGNNPTQRL
jgi:hypothetical protein